MSNFVYKNRLSSEFDLRVKSKQRPLLPDIRQNYVEVIGRDGSYDFSDNKLEDRIIEVSCAFIVNTVGELRYKIRELAAWLYGPEPTMTNSIISQDWQNIGGYGWLVFDDEPDIQYRAKVANKIDFEQTVTLGEFSIFFRCEPYGYSVETSQFSNDGINTNLNIFKEDKDINSATHNQLIYLPGVADKYTTIAYRKLKPTDKYYFENVINTLTASINNFGTAPVKPRIFLEGLSGDYIDINGTVYDIDNDPDILGVTIDYENFSCYALNSSLITPTDPLGKENKLINVTGDWWQLNPGYNTIPITGVFSCNSIQFIFYAKFI